jgi:putative pyruvate formate lyase activating enzyme
LLVRHLVMPRDLAGTEMIMHFLADEISRNTYVNILDRYQPVYNVRTFPEIDRTLAERDIQAAVDAAHRAGLLRLENGRAPLPR